MKKLLVALLSLVLVFAVVASVSAAAPTVTGLLQYEAHEDTGTTDAEKVDARIFFNGSINDATNYTVSLQYADTAANGANVKVREAFATYKTGLGNFSLGKIRITPSIIDLLGGVSPLAGDVDGITAAQVVVKYAYSFDDNTNVWLAVVPADSSQSATSKVEAGAFVAQLNTKASIFDLGLNYQYEGEGDAGYAFQASTTLFDSLKLWTELGRVADQTEAASSDAKTAYYVGAAYTIGKLTLEYEEQFNDDFKYNATFSGKGKHWGSKVSYAVNDNLTLELYHSPNYAIGGFDNSKNFAKAVISF
ncbi:porin-like protein [Hydrogenispora ethanolica]|uniref:Porin-like protein n=1 Tax=Hydrogenispora ethanolica TaxID=1082276 RepID=A0A4R1RGW7_HYDET|nr:porin [Hydrogenispora ethanolica]TCL65298.1 porin-like protein [Hydrogenispora ethanolica]